MISANTFRKLQKVSKTLLSREYSRSLAKCLWDFWKMKFEKCRKKQNPSFAKIPRRTKNFGKSLPYPIGKLGIIWKFQIIRKFKMSCLAKRFPHIRKLKKIILGKAFQEIEFRIILVTIENFFGKSSWQENPEKPGKSFLTKFFGHAQDTGDLCRGLAILCGCKLVVHCECNCCSNS